MVLPQGTKQRCCEWAGYQCIQKSLLMWEEKETVVQKTGCELSRCADFYSTTAEGHDVSSCAAGRGCTAEKQKNNVVVVFGSVTNEGWQDERFKKIFKNCLKSSMRFVKKLFYAI